MKKVFKKAISILLAAVMVFGTAPLAGFVGLDLPELRFIKAKAESETPTSGTCGENLTWTFDESTGELVISGTGAMTGGWYGSSNVPWNNYRSSIKSVTIAEGVTNIGNYAFSVCSNLENIIIPNSVTTIGANAFVHCSNLESIIIPNSVTSIGARAFAYCLSLDSITIPAGVISIGEDAFILCANLKKIIVNSANKEYSSDEHGVLFSKNKVKLIQYPTGNTSSSYKIPDSVTNIVPYAFFYCINLENVTISKNTVNIGQSAFCYCINLKSITIPKKIERIEYEAFCECKSLQDIYYGGSRTNWENIIIETRNEPLTIAKIHYNSAGPDGGSTENPDVPEIPNYDSSVVDASTVNSPTQTTISYGDSIVLHVDPSKIPEGGRVEWYPSNGNFNYSVSADGTTYTITPEKSGDTTFTALIYDAEGNIVSADTQTMTSKAGFFDKIIAFFKKLFGLTKIIPSEIKLHIM